MSTLEEDIGVLRKRGETDANILEALKSYQPDHAGDIDTLLKRGEDPSKVLDAFASFSDRPPAAPQRSIMGALRQGLASTLGGEAETIRQVAGDGVAPTALDQAANLSKPDDYTPAAESMGKKATWGQWAKALPYAVAEGAPGVAQDLAAGSAGAAIGALGGPLAPVTVPIGGALGFGGSYLSRSFGRDAKDNATARTGDANSTPSDGDRARALAQGVAGAALSRIGLGAAGGSVVKAVGGNLVRDIGGQVVKGAAADAATSAASDLTHQALTPGDAPVDTNAVFNAAATGAVAGGALRAGKGVADVNNQAKFSGIDPYTGQRLASRFADEDTSSPSTSFTAVSNVRRDLSTEVQRFSSDAGPLIRSLQTSVGPHDDTALVVAKAKADLKAGQALDNDTLDTLATRIGTHQEGANLVDALSEHSALNQVIQSGNLDNANQRFGGGITGNGLVQQFVKPFGRTSLTEAGAAMAIPALLGHGIHPQFAAGTLAGQAGVYSALLGVDKLLGNANPLDQFAQRFAPDSPPPSIMAGNANMPSFRQPGPGPSPSPGAMPGPSGGPQGGNTPSPVPSQPTAPQSPPTSPVGGAGPSATPTPGPAAPTSPGASPVTPQLALARALVARRGAEGGRKEQPVPVEPPKEPTGGPRPSAAPVPATNPQAALARLLLAQRGKSEGGPEETGSPAPTPAAPLGTLAMARAMSKAKGEPGNDAGPKAAQKARTSKGVDYHHDAENGNIIVNHGDHTVVRAIDGVQRVGDYANATHRNLVTRQQHFDMVTQLAEGPHDKGVMTTLHHQLNQRAKSWDDAKGFIQEAVEEKMQDTNWDHRAAIANKLLEPKMRATWTK